MKRPENAHTNAMSGKYILEITVFALGAAAYGLIEVLFRGHTHWTMVLTGGACVLTFYYLLEWLIAMPLAVSALAGAAIITAYEFFVGLVVNRWLGWQVWDYSAMPGNVMGQICPAFSAAWFGLCLVFFGILRLLV